MDNMTDSMREIDMDEKLRYLSEKIAENTSDLLFEIEIDTFTKKMYIIYQSYINAGFTKRQAFKLLIWQLQAAMN